MSFGYFVVHLIDFCSSKFCFEIHNISCRALNTGYTQNNCSVSRVNKKCISHLTRAQRTPSAAATVEVSHALPAVRFSCLLRGQFPRWRRSWKRLSVCSVLRCPDVCRVTQGARIEELWFSCVNHNPSVCAPWVTRHTSGHLKTEHTESLFCCDAILETDPAVSMRSVFWLRMRNLDTCCCWRCTLCPCKVRNKFLVDFWNRTILLCIPCIIVPILLLRARGSAVGIATRYGLDGPKIECWWGASFSALVQARHGGE